MSRSSNGDNNNMLDKGLSANICESMKARLVVSTTTTSSDTPTPTTISTSPPSTDPENNLNKSGVEKGIYIDKQPVLNIDYQNYTLNPPPTSNYRTVTQTSEPVLVNVTTPQEQKHRYAPAELRLPTTFACNCRVKSPIGSNFVGASSPKKHCGSSPYYSHIVSSLFPLIECRMCFHKECEPHVTHPCKRIQDPNTQVPPPTVPQDVVSTTTFTSKITFTLQ